jgi:hypothetical protein
MKAALAIAALIALTMTGCSNPATFQEGAHGWIQIPPREHDNRILMYRAPHIAAPVKTRDC